MGSSKTRKRAETRRRQKLRLALSRTLQSQDLLHKKEHDHDGSSCVESLNRPRSSTLPKPPCTIYMLKPEVSRVTLHGDVSVAPRLTRWRNFMALRNSYQFRSPLYCSPNTTGHQVCPRHVALGDDIKRLSEQKYSELHFPLPVDKDKLKKVLAAVVIKTDGPATTLSESLKVVALATGTKCIGGRYLRQDGNALQDCHAEVIVRRAFMRYLYNQLQKCLQQQEQNSILEKKTEGRYGIKPGISVHLYVSSSPCGDATVFGPSDNHPNRISRGVARVKIDSGEGAVQIQSISQNWQDIHRGLQRLQTMSCSDKIARWNVLGVQGSLLSMYLEPVYFQSVTIGSEVGERHFQRAVYGRVKSISELPTEYRTNCPHLHKVSSPGVKTGKSHDLSMNWLLEETVELVKCQNGLQHLSEAPSRLSKRAMFEYFASFSPHRIFELRLLFYSEMKARAWNYQQAKKEFFKQYVSLGGWVKKPPVVDTFHLQLCA